MKKLANRRDGVRLANWLVTVDREVAEILDNPRLGQTRRTNRVAKRWLKDQRTQAFAVRKLQSAIAFIEPMNGSLQSAACVKARGARISPRECLCFLRRLEQ